MLVEAFYQLPYTIPTLEGGLTGSLSVGRALGHSQQSFGASNTVQSFTASFDYTLQFLMFLWDKRAQWCFLLGGHFSVPPPLIFLYPSLYGNLFVA